MWTGDSANEPVARVARHDRPKIDIGTEVRVIGCGRTGGTHKGNVERHEQSKSGNVSPGHMAVARTNYKEGWRRKGEPVLGGGRGTPAALNFQCRFSRSTYVVIADRQARAIHGC